MTIVTGVPDNIRVPGQYATIDNSAAVQSSSLTQLSMLLIGTESTTGSTGPTDTVVQIFGDTDGVQWGEGGMLDRMIRKAKGLNTLTPMYAIALAEAGGSTAASLATTFSGTATAAGVIHMYVAGDYVPVPVAEGDDATTQAASAAAAITALTTLPVTATSALAVLTSLVKFTGVAGNSVGIQFNRGIKEEFPPGVSAPVTVLTAGTIDPSLVNAIAAMVDEQFTHIVQPYEDSTNQDLMEAELDARFGPEKQQWGISFTGLQDSVANLISYGNARNSQLQAYPAFDPGHASPMFESTAAHVAKGTTEGDPARPWQTFGLTNLAGAKTGVGLRFSFNERNQLLYNGIATTKVAQDGTVQIERTITSYQTNPGGADDISYLDLMTPVSALFFRDAINSRMQTRYPRHKLGKDGNTFGAGQPVMTPALFRNELISIFSDFEDRAILQDIDAFKESINVEVVAGGRLHYSCNPTVVSQFRVVAGTLAFILG